MMPYIFILALFIMTGCSQKGMTVRLEGIDHTYLASYQVDTPDPRLCSVFRGQQIVVSWFLPYCMASKQRPLTLIISYITGAHTHERVRVPVYSYSGTYVHRLMNCDFARIQGILSYKVEMYEDHILRACWKLPTYADWISIDD